MATLSETLSNAGKLIKHAFGAALSGVHAGERKIAAHQPQLAGPAALTLTSSAFEAGGPIPDQYTPQGQNVSPDLSWAGVPAAARELVLVVEDPDAPFPQPFVHWILHRIPTSFTSLPVGLPGERALGQLGGAVQGTNDAKTRGYFGPQPPLGHGVHHYHFQLFALDTQLSVGPDSTLDELKQAMAGHVLAFGERVGTYERSAV